MCIKMEVELDLLIFPFYNLPIKFYFLIFIIQIVGDVLCATLAEKDGFICPLKIPSNLVMCDSLINA